jgi:hypothetical protein
MRAAAALLATTTFAGTANAAIIDASIVIPDSEVLINFNNTGLDWVYVGPVAPNEFGQGEVASPSFRASEGWRAATAAEWSLRPTDYRAFTRPGFAAPAAVAGFSDHSSYRFASEYWSNFTHVDLNDYAVGRVTDGVNGLVSGAPETIYVRGSLNAAVPEPATWAMMIGGFGLLGASARRRTSTAVTFA